MQTQRDHVHAHTFMMGRLSSALVGGDPTGAEIPGRRAQTGLLAGVIVLVLVLGGFAVYGWIVPGGSRAYRQAGVILVEKETGNRYVVVDGIMHQVPDLASAMLIQGAAGHVKLISKNSLTGVPRGAPLGLVGAPRQLPTADALTQGPWLACLPSSVAPAGGGIGLGVQLDPSSPTTALPPDRFLVVRDVAGVRYLLSNQLKYRIDDEAVLVALGAAAIDPPPAPRMWLGWLREGPALAPAEIAGAGEPGPAVDGRRYPVGMLFRQRTATGSAQHFVLRQDGLAPMSRTEFLIADAATAQPPVEVGSAAIVAARRSADRTLLDRLPDLVSWQLAETAGRAVCMRQFPVATETVASVVVLAGSGDSGVVTADGTTTVRARPGSGMLVLPVPAAPAATRQVAFISDEGRVHHLADESTLAALKFSGVSPVPFPKDLLAAMPQGPVLSRKAVTSLAEG
ncbi:type VII secretion protein EccB [Micromonospora sp. HNM0581]|uniref:type VII secretion protein EccB n=1 Tax=Micromonospora sp. HNM0581 TaxID=2716341 RepID=UPI00146A5620|nr:type VII secretion protein EccB [Micromonospora sp. HNM0581]